MSVRIIINIFNIHGSLNVMSSEWDRGLEVWSRHLQPRVQVCICEVEGVPYR